MFRIELLYKAYRDSHEVCSLQVPPDDAAHELIGVDEVLQWHHFPLYTSLLISPSTLSHVQYLLSCQTANHLIGPVQRES